MKLKQILFVMAALVLSIAAERVFLGAHESHDWWTEIPGFFALFGFFACLTLIVLAKAMARYWLQRREEYYGREASDD